MRRYLFVILSLVCVAVVLLLYSLRLPRSPEQSMPSQPEVITPEKTTETKKQQKESLSESSYSSAEKKESPQTAGILIKAVTTDGQSIEGASVKVYRNFSILLPIPPTPIAQTTTNKTGEAKLSTDLIGEFILRVSKPGFARSFKRISIPDSHSRITTKVILRPESIVTGTLLVAGKKVLGGKLVGPLLPEPIPEHDEITFPEFTRTNEQGEFIFNGLSDQKYNLQVYVPGYIPAFIEGITPPQKNLKIVLQPGGAKVDGIVVGSRDGRPKPNIGLLLVGNNILRYTTSLEKGVFEFANLSAGDYYVEPILRDKRIGKPVTFRSDGKSPIEYLVVKINQGISITGKVVSAIDQRPLSEISLEIKEGNQSITVFSDARGEFHFSNIYPEGQVKIHIVTPDYYIKREGAVWNREFIIDEYMPEEDIKDVVLPLDKKYIIRGKVENLEPEEIGNYRVRILNIDTDTPAPLPAIKLNKDASFSISHIGSGKFIAGLIRKDGKLAGATVEFSLSPDQPEPFIKLSRGEPVVVAGRVLDDRGEPLEQCKVVVTGTFSTEHPRPDKNGTFKFETYEKKLTIQVSSPLYSERLEKEIFIPLTEELVFQFTCGNLLSGYVVTSDDEKVPRAKITYQWREKLTGAPKKNSIFSDMEGRFRITDVHSDIIDRLVCEGIGRKEGTGQNLGSIELENVTLPQEEFRIVLPYTLDFSITVLDENGTPYHGELTLLTKCLNTRGNSFEIIKREPKIADNGKVLMTAVNPGTYVYTVKTLDGRSGSSEKVVVTEEASPENVIIHLSQTGVINGYVYDSGSNAPIKDVRVVFELPESDMPQAERVATSTDPDGFFEIKGLADGSVNIHFTKTGYSTFSKTVSLEAGIPDVDLPLKIYLEPAKSALRGRVLNTQQEPVPSVAISVRRTDIQDEMLLDVRHTTSDNEGNFAIENLSEGEYLLIADKENLFFTDTLTLQPSETKEITITLQSKITVTGRLTTADKRLLEQPIIFLNKMTKKTYLAPLNKDGEFSILLPPGEYTLSVGETELGAEVSVPSDTEVFELDLSF